MLPPPSSEATLRQVHLSQASAGFDELLEMKRQLVEQAKEGAALEALLQDQQRERQETQLIRDQVSHCVVLRECGGEQPGFPGLLLQPIREPIFGAYFFFIL